VEQVKNDYVRSTGKVPTLYLPHLLHRLSVQ